jgi:hypothetical protein
MKPPIGSTSATTIATAVPCASALGAIASEGSGAPPPSCRRKSRLAFANPAAINVHGELGRALQQNRPDISAAQQHDSAIAAIFDDIVDNAALEFERHDFEQKDRDRQQHQRNLVLPTRRQDVAKQTTR